MIDAVRKQLEAIKATAEAALVLLGDRDPSPEDPTPAGPCEHPEDDRAPAGVMGKSGQYVCGVCKALVNPGEGA